MSANLPGSYISSNITTKFGDNAIAINDTVKNLSASPAEAQVLYHANFGDPLLDAGAKVVAPIKKGDHVHVHNVKTKKW